MYVLKTYKEKGLILNRKIFMSLHIIAICTVSISLLTGLRIASLNTPLLMHFDAILISGEVHNIHLISGYVFSALVLYVIYYQLHKKKPHKSQRTRQHHNKSYHQWVNRLGYTAGILSVFTGLLISLDLLVNTLQSLHFISALLFLLYLVMHSWIYILQHGKGVLIRVLPSSHKHIAWLKITSIFGLASLFYLLTIPVKHTLHVSSIPLDVLIEVDGHANEPQWLTTPSITLNTIGGANFVDGNTQVTIKALSNAQETFFLFSWKDPTHSVEHLPLLKTAQGWEVKENGFYHFDEQSHYEDKFAVMLSNTCNSGADGTTHLGKTPIKDKPSNWHGKGYHASLDNTVRDLWHWKAVRTNDMYLADDNFIGVPASVQHGKRRYSAGYQADGKESGAYVMNWQWYKPNRVTPKRLPTETLTEALIENQKVLPWFSSVPYKAELDTLPVGSYLPSVLYRSNRFEGDRADVRARGHWQNGIWTLELVRKKNTQSKHDITLKTGVCMWVSAFDRSQVAHTRHHKAITLQYQL